MLQSEVIPGTNYYFVAARLSIQTNIVFEEKLVLIPPFPTRDKCSSCALGIIIESNPVLILSFCWVLFKADVFKCNSIILCLQTFFHTLFVVVNTFLRVKRRNAVFFFKLRLQGLLVSFEFTLSGCR